MFDRHAGGERSVLVHLHLKGIQTEENFLTEFQELVQSAGGQVISFLTANRYSPDSKYFVGKGKAEEIALLIEAENIDMVIFNHNLSPAQERNLEQLFNCRVLDRTTLVLDIFALRARSFEGKLQVELAQLKHLSTRLIRGWTHLERQKGGIGMRGPGETQLETDRRLVSKRIDQIQSRLAKVHAQREQSRRGRVRAEIPTMSLVGYTNAGKSTLFNHLTKAEVYVADQLFATLDPTLRRLDFAQIGQVVLADTVGFISNLPHELVAAFKSTLQETIQADLLLHLVDATDKQRVENIAEVERILKEIGADKQPTLYIYNKIDLDENLQPHIEYDDNEKAKAVWLSAKTGQGIDLLEQVIIDFFSQNYQQQTIILDPSEGRLHALLHQKTTVINEKMLEQGGWEMTISFEYKTIHQLIKTEKSLQNRLQIEANVNEWEIQ